MTVRWRAVWLGLALGLTCLIARAVAPASPLVLDEAPSQLLTGHLAVLDDPDAAFDLAAVRRADAAGRFVAQSGGGLSFGYRAGAVWVRFSLTNRGTTPQQRWLALENPFLAS